MDGLIDLTTPASSAYSIMPDPPATAGHSLLSPTPNLLNGGDMTAPALPQPPTPPPERFEDTIRDFADVDKTRANIYSRVLAAAQKLQPVSNARHTLRLVDVDYQDPDKVSLQEQKQAILGRTSRGRRLRGTWELLDNATGEILDRKKSVLMSVPHMTERGTFIHNGSEYTLKNQQRLRPGVFTRVKDNGEIETHVNVMPGKGVSHRYYLDPDKSVFKLKVGQGTVGLMPLLKTMGATAEQIKEAWGPDMFAANYNADNASEYVKLQSKFLTEAEMQEAPDVRSKLLREKFEKTELDPEVTRATLGGDYRNLNLDALLAISKKLIAVSRTEAEPDDRDSLAYQQFFGPEDLIAERLERDKGHLRRQLLWRASAKGNLRSMPSSALSSQVEAALLTSGLGQAIEEINPIELLDKLTAVTRMGEGGIASTDAIPRESRSVQPSMFGYMDPVRTPESGRVGVDNYFARNAKKGRDGKLYAAFQDARTGQTVHKTPQEVAGLTLGFPGSLTRTAPRVTAMRAGKMVMVPKEEIDCILPNMEDAFNALTNMVPMKSNVKGQRTVMASRMLTQALPVEDAEAPLVQSAVPGTDGQKSFEELYASAAGTVRAKMGGVVQAVSGDGITIRYDDGTTDTKELYNNFPFNRKTSLHQTPLVQPGQRVTADALLAKSNFTDRTGTVALGKNARTAYMAWEGKNFEDAIVISQGFADKMKSEHIYQHDLDVDAKTRTGKKSFVSLFPAEYSRETLNKFDPTGVIRVGEKVEYGEPLILAAKEKESAYNKVHKRGQAGHSNSSVTWDHHDPGVVTDVVMGKDGPSVVVKTFSPTRVGDKISGRYGDKGVVADVIPDHRMPQGSDGKPFEVLLNPAGIITRTNPSQMIELALGKLAAKQGKPIKVPDFDDSKDMSQWAADMLAQAGLGDTEDVLDPSRDQYVRGIATGNRFFMKLHHTAEGKGQSRGGGGYTAEETPAKGGESGSKRIGVLETNALLSHGAVSTLQDIKNIRGQKNDEYWMQFMAGYNPTVTKVPFVYRKFVNQLKAAGVNVVKSGTQTNIMAMTDKDVDELAGDRELADASGVDWEHGLKELRGGLFDKAMTGGHGGDRWAAIKLTEPLPNPAMEEPLRHILRLTNKQFRGVLSGEHSIGSFGTGPTAMKKALDAIDLPKEIERTRAIISGGRKSERDSAIRRLGYLKSAHKLGLHPADYMLKRVPVLPPSFRPVSLMSNDMPLVADANVLYKELMEANKNWDLLQKEVGSDGVGSDRLVVYDAFKAVTGLGDPITQKSQDRNVKGLLKSVFGSSPKYGTVQRKLISTTVDNVGRAVITPNPDLDMDTVGLPEDKAYNAYEKFVTRRLVRQGMAMSQALEAIKERKPVAQKALLEEMETRPVYISRAPVLHKFGIMAFKPVLTKSDTLQVSPLIVKGFNADFDGDTMNYHVPSSDAAREEALTRMLPSKNIFSVADMRSVVHAPANEYVGGLYHATSSKNEDRPKKIFQTIADMRKAYARGDVLAGDRVQILEKK